MPRSSRVPRGSVAYIHKHIRSRTVPRTCVCTLNDESDIYEILQLLANGCQIWDIIRHVACSETLPINPQGPHDTNRAPRPAVGELSASPVEHEPYELEFRGVRTAADATRHSVRKDLSVRTWMLPAGAVPSSCCCILPCHAVHASYYTGASVPMPKHIVVQSQLLLRCCSVVGHPFHSLSVALVSCKVAGVLPQRLVHLALPRPFRLSDSRHVWRVPTTEEAEPWATHGSG